jgi:hypothetical protein
MTKIYYSRSMPGKQVTIQTLSGKVTGNCTGSDDNRLYLMMSRRFHWEDIVEIEGIPRDQWEKESISKREGIPVDELFLAQDFDVDDSSDFDDYDDFRNLKNPKWIGWKRVELT